MACGNSESDAESDTPDAPDVISEATSPGGPESLSLDTVFEVLANRRRRFSLYVLLDTADRVRDLSELVNTVTDLEAEHDTDSEENHREAVRSDLHHWHLPVLAEVGIVDYDERSAVVRYHRTPTLERWLRRVHEDEFGSS